MAMGDNRNKDRFEKWQHCGGWKLPFRHHREVTQNYVNFTNPCINLLVPPSVSREYRATRTCRFAAA